MVIVTSALSFIRLSLKQ